MTPGLAVIIGLCALYVIVSAAISLRRKWRDVKGIQRSYWFDEWIL